MQDILIVARSGRSLAASAKRAGYRTHVLDCYSDADTRSLAVTADRLLFVNDHFEDKSLIDSVKNILSLFPGTAMVLGSGFEANPFQIEQLKHFAPVYSNSAGTIKSVKQPEVFFNLLDEYSIKHPETSFCYPDSPEDFLIKSPFGMGGEHVQRCRKEGNEDIKNCYFQKYIAGVVSSVVFLANGESASIVGFNQQWQSRQFESMPFLYGGACSLPEVSEQQYAEITHIVDIIVEQTGLKGLCGLDYILTDKGDIYVLEINPRPPATFELHETETALFRAHISCFDGRFKDIELERYPACRAYVILYAEHDIQIPIDFEWPLWVKDRPSAGTRIRKYSPVCTIHVEEDSLSDISKAIQSCRHQLETTLVLFKDAA